jgi:hypothetical protein
MPAEISARQYELPRHRPLEDAMTDRGIGLVRLVAVVFTPIGIIMLALAGWFGNRQYSILKTWPSVEAEVARSEVTRGRDSEGNTTYGTEIEFRYRVNGREFRTPSSSSYRSSSYKTMKEKADEYSPGTRHSILYNPSDPADVRFDAGYNLGFFFLPAILGGMGLVFAGLGVVFLWVSRSEKPLRCPSCGQPVSAGQNFCPGCAAALPPEIQDARG